MATRSKKERKQQRRRHRKDKELARRIKRRLHASDEPSPEEVWIDEPEPFDEDEPIESRGEADEQGLTADDFAEEADETLAAEVEDETVDEPDSREEEKAVVERWWEEFEAADGPTALMMVRDQLRRVPPEDPCFSRFFPEAIDELASSLPRDQYVAFLEELNDTWHDVFKISADWFVCSMAFHYLAEDRLDDLDQVVTRFAAELEQLDGPFISIVTMVRLAGREGAAQALTDAAVRRLEDSDLMYWAVEIVLEWAMFPAYRLCLVLGATDGAIEELRAVAAMLDVDESEEAWNHRRDRVLMLAGKSERQWTRAELTSNKRTAMRKIHLLCMAYQRWLYEQRGLPPIVTDELRRMLIETINGVDCPFGRVLDGLCRREFEPHLARKLDFLSLNRIAAPASVLAMKHFYDFLKHLGLMKPSHCGRAQRVCDELWRDLQHSLKAEWASFRFLERYLPGRGGE